MLTSHGDNRPCDQCAAPMLARDVAVNIVFPDGSRVGLHIGCLAVWEAEQRRMPAGPLKPGQKNPPAAA